MLSKLLTASASVVGLTAASCNLFQTCANNEGKQPGQRLAPCADPSAVAEPVFYDFEPEVMTNPLGLSNLALACPFIDPTQALCCNSDNAAIMQFNYGQLNAVFESDCSICASNLKRMWCEYACNPLKAGWLSDQGERPATPPLTGMWRNVETVIDADYACGLFTSCKRESFISQAGVTNAKQFLDFQGTNGAPFSLSWITFETEKDSNENTALQGTEGEDWFSCEYDVPEDGLVIGYPDNHNTTCSFCDNACTPPVVNDDIGFLDGLSWYIVGYSYLGYVVLTIIFQLVLHFCCKSKELAKIQAEVDAYENQDGQGRPLSSQQRAQGRPLNMTDDNNSGVMQDSRNMESGDSYTR